MALFGIAEAVVGVVDNVLDKFVEDKDLRAKLDHELKTQVQRANLGQIAVNQEQARHPSIFVAGARPAIMWICAFGLGWQFVFQPVCAWAMTIWAPALPIPIIPTACNGNLSSSYINQSILLPTDLDDGTYE